MGFKKGIRKQQQCPTLPYYVPLPPPKGRNKIHVTYIWTLLSTLLTKREHENSEKLRKEDEQELKCLPHADIKSTGMIN